MKLTEEFWDNKYKTNSIAWDIGNVSTPLKFYFDQLHNKKITILIPGGGNSYEAEYLHKLGFKEVFVVDISKTAIKNFKNRVPTFPSENLIHQDFFTLNKRFDLIIEQTFFCALNPLLRSDYAKKIAHLLKENGKLVGLLFDDKLNENHPPFGGNKTEYLRYFTPYFKTKYFSNCYNSIPSRDGRELFINLVKKHFF